jgi:WD40 repeat protein
LAVNSDGTLLAGEDGSHHEVRLMNARTGHVVATMNRYDKYGRIESLAFSPHAPLLAIASAGGSAKNSIEGVISIWKVAQCTRGKRCTPRRKRVLAVSKPVLSVAFSPDGSLIAAGSSDGVGRVWHWRDRPVPKPFELTGDAISSIGAIAFSADGHRIATSAADTTIRIWDAQQGHLLGVLRSHTDLVNTVQFDPHDSSKVLSASNDGTATISTCKNMCASVDVARALAESRQHEARQPPSWLPDDRP